MITAALLEPSSPSMAQPVLIRIMECLQTMVSEAHWRHKVWEAMQKRATTKMTELTVQLMQRGRAEAPISAANASTWWAGSACVRRN